MTSTDVARTGLAVLVRSGLAKPVAPRKLLRITRAVRRGGTNPATALAIAAARWPGRTAVIDDDGAITYRDLQLRCDRLAVELSERHGVRAGEAVGILLRNGRGFAESVFAAASIGADVVLLNTEFRQAALAAAISAHNIRVVLCDREFCESVGEHARAVHPAEPSSTTVVRRRVSGPPGRIIVLTSGTTGTPKGVPRTPAIGPTLGIAASVLHRTRLRTGSRIVLAVPMFHAFGFAILMLSVALGATMITRRRFDAEAALAQASLHRADAFAAVPIMLARILDLPEAVSARNPADRLRVVISGGAPLSPVLAERFMDAFGDILYNGYGSSEVGIGTFATPADLRDAPGTVGRPVAGSPVRILDNNGNTLGANVIGRIFVGGDLAFDGYTGGGGKEVVANLTSTGDMGYTDEKGRLFIVGRDDDMIVSGGENVYPQAVENALAEHPDVADSAVVGVSDEDYGQRLTAFVVPRENGAIDVDELRNFLKRKVSRFEQPRDIRFVSSIPRNPAGKVLRRELLGS
ncbi:AMP-binding protein [Antrihabitans sp. YC2-6]|uniref:AMP-binding protein n=1 Tax=Antrihabitans sp. YC2-6 TaxID=2799498 RepID=UPI0018F3CB16|nr:AMP-binding protein [Antrihabitans sp. YC2-6]MBJ8343805.1 AMP-binding protein [Antrihabitans sp. YC2-6]